MPERTALHAARVSPTEQRGCLWWCAGRADLPGRGSCCWPAIQSRGFCDELCREQQRVSTVQLHHSVQYAYARRSLGVRDLQRYREPLIRGGGLFYSYKCRRDV